MTDVCYSCVTLESCVQKSVQPVKIEFGPTFLKLRVSPIKALQANFCEESVLTALSLFVPEEWAFLMFPGFLHSPQSQC